MIIISMLLLVLVLLVIGVPMGFAMGLGAVLVLWVQGQVPLIQLPLRFFSAIDSYALMAVLLFILAGNLMNVGGITTRIVNFAKALVGHLRGGLAQVNIVTSVMFGSVNGSAVADTAAVGSMLIPAMKKEGYTQRFSVVVTCISALIVPIIPPSIPSILYGSMTGTSIGRMFMAGIVPGVLLALGLMTLTWFLASRYGWKPSPRASWREIGSAFVATIPALTMPFIIVGGIVAGIFTPTEAGAVAVLYGLVVSALARSMNIREFFEMIVTSAKLTTSALIILAGSGLFAWVLIREGFAFMLRDSLLALTTDPTLVLLVIIAGLFVLGLVLEGMAALIIAVPILHPIALSLGYDPAQFGIIVIIMVLLGSVSPPVGVVVQLACKIGGIPFASTFRLLVPYIAVVIGVVLLVAFIPALTTFLPDLLM
jgi:tripartite ATP-independent transporter DctM subunit